jgi:hypothetical protein
MLYLWVGRKIMPGGRGWGWVWLMGVVVVVMMRFGWVLVALVCVCVMGLVTFVLHLEACSGTFMATRTLSQTHTSYPGIPPYPNTANLSQNLCSLLSSSQSPHFQPLPSRKLHSESRINCIQSRLNYSICTYLRRSRILKPNHSNRCQNRPSELVLFHWQCFYAHSQKVKNELWYRQ